MTLFPLKSRIGTETASEKVECHNNFSAAYNERGIGWREARKPGGSCNNAGVRTRSWIKLNRKVIEESAGIRWIGGREQRKRRNQC